MKYIPCKWGSMLSAISLKGFIVHFYGCNTDGDYYAAVETVTSNLSVVNVNRLYDVGKQHE